MSQLWLSTFAKLLYPSLGVVEVARSTNATDQVSVKFSSVPLFLFFNGIISSTTVIHVNTHVLGIEFTSKAQLINM